VVRLDLATSEQTVLPFPKLAGPSGVAVDGTGSVYVADSGRVLKLKRGAESPEVLPFSRRVDPKGIAVDAAGNVYITDGATGWVLKLPIRSSRATAK
jgi:serine/threonine-protein kinase